jgi:glycopeptide antibiotics resistance protein
MTFWQAIASLLVPAHFSDWYVADAAQGTHVAFGFTAFAIFGTLLPLLLRWRVSPHLALLLGICATASWEIASLLVYGGSVADRVTNIAFMAFGASFGWSVQLQARRLLSWAVVAFVLAMGLNAWVRL